MPTTARAWATGEPSIMWARATMAARPAPRGAVLPIPGPFPSRGEVRAGYRAGDPRRAQQEDEDVLPVRAGLRRAAEHAHLPDLPRPAGLAAGGQRRGDP